MTTNSANAGIGRCPRCGAVNDCAIAAGRERCWCMAEPPTAIAADAAAADCYCRDCLRALSSQADAVQLHKRVVPR